MVQGIENLTQLEGTIVSSKRHLTLPDYDVVTLDVVNAEPVEGKANLLTMSRGSRIDVTVRRALLTSAQPGSRVHLRAKRTMDGAMAEPHPEPGHFRIE